MTNIHVTHAAGLARQAVDHVGALTAHLRTPLLPYVDQKAYTGARGSGELELVVHDRV